MDEDGVVRSVEGDHAVVSLTDQGGCESCPSAGICHAEGNERRVNALNPVGARPGQRVRVTMHAQMYLKGTLLVYALPVIALIAGAISGQLLAGAYLPTVDPDLAAAGLGLGGMVAVFLGAKRWSRKVEKSERYLPVIEKILDDGG